MAKRAGSLAGARTETVLSPNRGGAGAETARGPPWRTYRQLAPCPAKGAEDVTSLP